MDQLALDYAGQPVAFIEHDVNRAPPSRYGRWWAGFSGGSAVLPLIMVDSGNQVSQGYASYYKVYGSMVDTALARPPQAGIQATWWRAGDQAQFYIRVHNQLTETLSSSLNEATVHAIVYEDVRLLVTGRYSRAAVESAVTDLAPDGTVTLRLDTAGLAYVNWDKLHAVVALDYRPAGHSGPFDMLQAAAAQRTAGGLVAVPDRVSWVIDPSAAEPLTETLTLEGPAFSGWTATPGVPWIAITPAGGTMDQRPVLRVIAELLADGWQEGAVQVATTDGLLSSEVRVGVQVTRSSRLYLPLAAR